MRTQWRQIMCGLAIALALGLLALPVAKAIPYVPLTLSFNELADGEEVHEYYSGGLGGSGTGPGPDHGVTFAEGFTVSPPDVYPWNPTGNSASGGLMNLNPGFVGWISFYYLGSGEIRIYSGPNGTGVELVYEQFPDEGEWWPVGVVCDQVFQSVEFSGFLRFDPLVFSSLDDPHIVVPEPPALALLGLGALAALRRRRR